ncbi:MAG: hypothetical protein GY841_17985 [FCB group bacterium]|nr:hypothetical protein [FCB group bacterium]
MICKYCNCDIPDKTDDYYNNDHSKIYCPTCKSWQRSQEPIAADAVESMAYTGRVLNTSWDKMGKPKEPVAVTKDDYSRLYESYCKFRCELNEDYVRDDIEVTGPTFDQYLQMLILKNM